MSKQNLIDTVAQQTGVTKARAEIVVNAVVRGLVTALVNGNEVRLTDLGCFTPVNRPDRKGRHPVTGEPMVLTANTTVRFKPGTRLLRGLN